ncbi:MAG: cation-efflux pump, partial [Oscillospiraceae bacterium]|nr:cation-efflux pump [Oscillospiraceae bacterium]
QVIVETVSGESRVLGYHDLMVHDYGPGQRFASIHVEMDQKEDPLLCHELIDEMERICLEKHNIHLVVHYDPVVTDDEELNALQSLVRKTLQELDGKLTVHDFRMVRRSELNTLFFDVGTPQQWENKTQDIQKAIENALKENFQSVYDVRITFDLEAFNL